jgi:hypothetical protein
MVQSLVVVDAAKHNVKVVIVFLSLRLWLNSVLLWIDWLLSVEHLLRWLMNSITILVKAVLLWWLVLFNLRMIVVTVYLMSRLCFLKTYKYKVNLDYMSMGGA